MHLGHIWAFLYFDVHRSGHFEKRSLADKRNEKSTLTLWHIGVKMRALFEFFRGVSSSSVLAW